MVALPVNYFNHGPINSDHVIDKITQHVKVQVLSTNEWLHTDRWLCMRRNMEQKLGWRASSGNAVSALDARPRRKLSPGFRDKPPARTPGRGAGTLQLARSSTRPLFKSSCQKLTRWWADARKTRNYHCPALQIQAELTRCNS